MGAAGKLRPGIFPCYEVQHLESPAQTAQGAGQGDLLIGLQQGSRSNRAMRTSIFAGFVAASLSF